MGRLLSALPDELDLQVYAACTGELPHLPFCRREALIGDRLEHEPVHVQEEEGREEPLVVLREERRLVIDLMSAGGVDR